MYVAGSCHNEGKRRSVSSVSRQQLKFLALCQKGDAVTTPAGEGVIDIIDPFNRTLDLVDGRTISASDLMISGKFNLQ